MIWFVSFIIKSSIMTQTLLYNKLKIRPVIPTLSIPSIDQHQSHHNYCWIRYDTSRTDHCHRCCRHILETPRKTMASLKSWMGLGSTNRYSRHSINSTTRTFVFLRGGSDGNVTITLYPITEDQKYTVRLTDPAPGSPFHYAFPVHDFKIGQRILCNVLCCAEGRSSTKWQDYSLHGHQIVAHWVGNNGDEVPVPRTFIFKKTDTYHFISSDLTVQNDANYSNIFFC